MALASRSRASLRPAATTAVVLAIPQAPRIAYTPGRRRFVAGAIALRGSYK